MSINRKVASLRVLEQFAIASTVVALGFASCKREKIEVRDESSNDYQLAELEKAVATFVTAGRSAEAFAQLGKTILAKRTLMDATVAADAELKLVTMALAPTQDAYRGSKQQAAQQLATTIWPFGLAAAIKADSVMFQRSPTQDAYLPLANETAGTYLERICGSVLRSECYAVVPEFQAEVVGQLVVRRFKERVRVAVGDCVTCINDPKWREVVRAWEQLEIEISERSYRAAKLGDPIRWPAAGKMSQPADGLEQAMLVEFSALGEMLVGGERISSIDRTSKLRDLRAGRAVLLQIAPQTSIISLRKVITELQSAGAPKIGIVARRAVYPWQPRIYWVAIGNGRRLSAKIGETVQVLLSAIDDSNIADLVRLD